MQAANAAERHLLRADPVLARVISFVRERAKGTPELFRPDKRDPLESLAHSIVSQQLSSAAARTIYGRVRTLLPSEFTAAALLRVPVLKLRTAGLSGSKARFVQEIAQASVDGRLDFSRLERLDDDAVREHLCAIKGVGPWTAQMFLMFKLRRPDVLPVGDGGIQRAIEVAWRRKRPTPQQVEQIAKPWRPHATTACLFLWSALDLGLGRKGPAARRAERKQ